MLKALIFDVFGTVVDWRSGVAAEAKRFFDVKGIGLDPFEFADAWRGEYQPTMERVRSGNRGYVPLDELHRENLDIVLDRFDLAGYFDAADRVELNHAWEKLPPWPDSVPGLTALKEDFIVAPCSNGSIALMTRMAKFGGLPWDAILGADIAGNYKPREEVYLASCNALRLEPSQVMMVAAHPGDLDAAKACGLMTAFIPRPLEFGPSHENDPQADHHAGMRRRDDWNYTAESVKILAEILMA
ncbi:MAG: haloacid dehalogenase type II [Salaquimonas sp.]|jgi:2-haloacid dehalogenase|nr:haloacid dehalogenase type II [Salaquimonas sp.]